MKKIKLLFCLSLLILSFIVIDNVSALSMGRVTNYSGVTMRSGPGTNNNKITTLSYNDIAVINSTYKIPSQKDCSSGWYNVTYNKKNGYICSDYLSTSTYTVRVNSKVKLKIRDDAGTSYPIYKELDNDYFLTLSSITKKSGTGCSNGWYSLNYNTYKNKYICSAYTDNYNSKSNVIVTNLDGVILKNSTFKDTTTKINYNEGLTLYDKTLYKGKNCSSDYYKVYYKNKEYYVCSTDVLNTNTNGTINYYAGVNIRAGAGTNYEKTNKLPYGTNVSLENTTKYEGSGCSNGWYKFKLNGESHYVCSIYVSLTNITDKVINAESVNIRKGPSTSYEIIKNIPQDTLLLLNNTKKYLGNGCPKGWYNISLDGKDGYICGSYINFKSDNIVEAKEPNKVITKKNTSSGNYYLISNWTYRINENFAYAWSKASSSSSLKDTLYLGTEVEVLDKLPSGNGCTDGWYKISYYNNRIGYICNTYVDKYEDVTKTDKSYCNTLKNEGFPESYCPYLSYLHSKYPNWIFKAEKTKSTFLDAIDGEANKNYTQITNSSYLVSDAIAEKGGWRVANDAYTAFMLDPRNYLNEKNIFAFENLSFDEKNHTTEAVRSIVSGSYLDTKENAGYFVKYGKDYKISPVHLAARAKQEGAANENYDAVRGDVKTKWNKTTGYVCSSYTVLTENEIGTVQYNYGSVNIRDAAGSNNKLIYTVENNDELILDSTELHSGTGCKAGWYKININGNDGYICSNYLKIHTMKDGVINTTLGYTNIRENAGTDSEIKTSINNDEKITLSDITKYEGTGCKAGWYKINLDETEVGYVCSSNIVLDKPKYQKGSIKTSSYLNIRGGASTNFDIITTAKNKNTFNLLSTKKYEGTGCKAGWYKIELDGYPLLNTYNMYNIGSYGDNPVLRGLAAAAGYVDKLDGTPWDSIEKAIQYGAKFIAEGYISKGQDTLYYQKFNTGPNSHYSKYTHQYMTNILAPANEGLSTYRSYTKLGLINKKLVFKIPVYDQMPASNTTHPPVTK